MAEQMFVARLADGNYLLSIQNGKYTKCVSRLRAAQFNRSKADQLSRLIQVEIIEATWEQAV